ncbi:VOC family protein [Deinococcus taklimakanensis]|uniref:VOC family protein n=1 Tax=Deinococcus taklimakanensis TaxID=536443 RepID=A0ABW5P386_9DEIO
MLSIGSVVWGVKNLNRAIVFWTAALNYRLRNDPDDDWAVLVPVRGHGVQLALKVVTSERARRHHLDLYTDDRAAEVERLLGLGATRPEWTYEPDADYVVLADPDGNRFCVIQKDEGLPAWQS